MGAEILLHGDLDLWIDKARDLPNMDAISSRARRLFPGCRDCLGPPPSEPIDHPSHRRRRDEEHLRKIITSDPYVKVTIAGATVARTAVVRNETEPQWNEHFTVLLAHHATHLEFQVKDNDAFGAEVIGTAMIPAARIAGGEPIQGWLEIVSPFFLRPPKPDSAIYVRLHFKPFDMNYVYRNGLSGVQGTYFPVRRGGSVTLYQDAHVNDQDLQNTIELDGGRAYRRERCWEDICQAILEARHMIYIVGWSVYDKVRLLREPTPGRIWSGLGKNLTLEELERMTLGELLKYKSQEGVRVCLLVWDDRTSNKNLFINTVHMLN